MSNPSDPEKLKLVSLMLPQGMIAKLKAASLTPEHSGKYQVLMRKIIAEWLDSRPKPRTSGK